MLLDALRLHTHISPSSYDNDPRPNSVSSNSITNSSSSSSFRSLSLSRLPPSSPSPSPSFESPPSVLSAASALAVQWGWFAAASLSTTPRRAALLRRLGVCEAMMATLASVVATAAATATATSAGNGSAAVAVASDVETLGDVLQVRG